jgi:hypothetical protein
MRGDCIASFPPFLAPWLIGLANGLAIGVILGLLSAHYQKEVFTMKKRWSVFNSRCKPAQAAGWSALITAVTVFVFEFTGVHIAAGWALAWFASGFLGGCSMDYWDTRPRGARKWK